MRSEATFPFVVGALAPIAATEKLVLTEADLAAIEMRARAVVPIGYLVTALSGSLAPEKGEEQAYLIAKLCDKDVPTLVAEVRRLRSALEAAQSSPLT